MIRYNKGAIVGIEVAIRLMKHDPENAEKRLREIQKCLETQLLNLVVKDISEWRKENG